MQLAGYGLVDFDAQGGECAHVQAGALQSERAAYSLAPGALRLWLR
jgi:hypothetical protein